jgi:hypothetical protein
MRLECGIWRGNQALAELFQILVVQCWPATSGLAWLEGVLVTFACQPALERGQADRECGHDLAARHSSFHGCHDTFA